MRAQRAQVLFRLDGAERPSREATAAVTALERLTAAGVADAAWTLATARVLGDGSWPRPAILAKQSLRFVQRLDWLDHAATDRSRRAEATCELARARILQGHDASDALGRCLPVYRAWGLAEREVVDALERLDRDGRAEGSVPH
jgi:hypothetical protein